VSAVDGTQVPIRLSGKQIGNNRTLAITGGAVATGALVFPYSSPVALVWGLKKGEEAVLRGSRVFQSTTGTQMQVSGIPQRKDDVVYRDRATVKASEAPPTVTNFDRGSFKPKGGFRPQ
jgi:hypothetical protein